MRVCLREWRRSRGLGKKVKKEEVFFFEIGFFEDGTNIEQSSSEQRREGEQTAAVASYLSR